jgi:survival-of-motor-neuron-related-splicing factor 30
MDLVQKSKQDNWQSFMQGKGSKKKTGFLTGSKKESIFKVYIHTYTYESYTKK